MPPLAWLALVMAVFPTLIWVPTHLILSKTVGRRSAAAVA
jgi:hypothetical protein